MITREMAAVLAAKEHMAKVAIHRKFVTMDRQEVRKMLERIAVRAIEIFISQEKEKDASSDT